MPRATGPRLLILLLLLALAACSTLESPGPTGRFDSAGGGLLVTFDDGWQACSGRCAWSIEIDRSGAVRAGFIGDGQPGVRSVGMLDPSTTARLVAAIDAADFEAIRRQTILDICPQTALDGPALWDFTFFPIGGPVPSMCRYVVGTTQDPFRTLLDAAHPFRPVAGPVVSATGEAAKTLGP